MFHSDWLILRILDQSFEIERPKGHRSDVVAVLLYDISTVNENVLLSLL